MTNVTITLEEEVAHWVRIQAAEQHTSVARYLGEILRQRMNEDQGYEWAMRRFLERTPNRISSEAYPRREDLQDRAGLRGQ
jgi:plasmid stability protein